MKSYYVFFIVFISVLSCQNKSGSTLGRMDVQIKSSSIRNMLIDSDSCTVLKVKDAKPLGDLDKIVDIEIGRAHV